MSNAIVFVFGCFVSLIVLAAVATLLWATSTDRASAARSSRARNRRRPEAGVAPVPVPNRAD